MCYLQFLIQASRSDVSSYGEIDFMIISTQASFVSCGCG